MKPFHIALAVLIAALWGFNFVVIRVGLVSFPPILMAALRFVIAALPVLVLPRPAIPWSRLVLTSATLFIGQYALLFYGMAQGMPAGLASTVLQIQAFLTMAFAAFLLREKPTGRQIVGAAIALAGLTLVGASIHGGATGSAGAVSAVGFGLTLAAAVSWAIGNVMLRGAGKVDMLATICWLSLIPPLPLLALSLALEGPAAWAGAWAGLDWTGIGAVLYIGLISTVVCFAIWGHLFKLYPASTVAPFSLLVPIFGALSASLLLGETFGPLRLAGMLLIVGGLAALSLRLPRSWRRSPVAS
ncbi:O-acetylserine/cysteine efflux transporter [Faunimonas pinastri]|uniref:O-acetylserine/cysteine efflux transporter n=1 Tax=Faunimonas pinastri TaxID=1855383 RepID=A0A1H9CPV3_9HYPH|nr:EamA family transporter [Faunimonas pinastri]SEQ03199.1 O-acetylserine/cysteine efflux transporter [Faunimonas pinastri]